MGKRRKRPPSRVPSGLKRPVQRTNPRPDSPRPAVVDDAGPGESGSRFAPVRRRAAQAKVALATGAFVLFVVGVVATRASYAGHTKHPLHALAAPPGFVQIVRRNLLQAGIVAPAQAPPGASTSVS
jgi:hypothetical protein